MLRGPVITHWDFPFADLSLVAMSLLKNYTDQGPSGLTDIFPSKACIGTDKSLQGIWSMVICFSSQNYWVVDTILHSALNEWRRTSSPPLPQGHLTDAGWWGQSPVHAVPWALHSRCWQGGCSWAEVFPEACQQLNQTAQLWCVAQDSVFAPLGWLQ